MRRLKPLLISALASLFIAVAALFVVQDTPGRADDQQTLLASVISSALSSPDITVKVGAVDGPLSSKSTIHDITLADRDGVFLSIDRAQLEWRRVALLSRRLEVDRLSIGRISYLRQPVKTAPTQKSDAPLLPELPLKVVIKAFEMAELVLDERVVGHAARLGAKGRATLGPPAEGLDAEIGLDRLDRGGQIALKLLFVPQSQTLNLAVAVNEPQGGLLAHLASLEGSPAVDFTLNGQGPLDAWQASLDFSAGPEISARGSASLTRMGDARVLALEIRGRLANLLPAPVAEVFTGETSLLGQAALADGGAVRLDRLTLASDLAQATLNGTVAADRTLDLTLQLASKPGVKDAAGKTEKSGTRIRDLSIGNLALTLRVAGPLLAPDITGGFTVRDVRYPALGFDSAETQFSLRQPGAAPGRIAATGSLKGLRLSTAELTRAVGGEIMLTVEGALGADQVADVRRAEIRTPTLNLGWTGRIGFGLFDGRLAGAIRDLSAFDPRLKGGATLAGTLKGQGADTVLNLEIAAPALTALGRPVRDLGLALTARDPFGRIAASFKAGGQIDGHPLAASARFAQPEPGVQLLEMLEATLGANRFSGALTRRTGGVEGQLAIEARSLGQLSAVLLTELSGAISGTITLAAPEGRQRMDMRLRGNGFRAGGIVLGGLEADLTLADALAAPRLSGTATATGITLHGQALSRAALVAKATTGGSDVVLDARGPGTSLSTAASIAYGEMTRIDITRFAASRGAAAIRLLRPATLTLRDGNAAFDQIAIGLGSGRILVSGQVGKTLGVKLGVTKVQLAALRALAPNLGLSGSLDAEAELSGTPQAPSGPFRATIAQFEHPTLRHNGLPRLDISVKGALVRDRATLDATIKGGAKLNLTVAGNAPLHTAGPLDLAIRGVLDAALANASLAGGGQRLTGKVKIEARLKGTAAAPRIEGSAVLAGGSFTDPLQGVKFGNLTAQLAGAGDRLRIEKLTATTAGGGTIGVTGSILVDPARGMPADLAVTGRKARLVENDVMVMVADLDLSLRGPLAATPSLGGTVRIASLDVMIPDRLNSAAAPLPNARHIGAPPQTRTRLAMIEKQKQQRARRRAASQGGARLAIRLDAPSRIFVRGRGLDAELGGSLQIGGTLHAPQANGGFTLRRGQLDLLTQRLAFSQGRITFNGDIVPELDFVASTSAGDVTAKITVSGRADEPSFTLSSQPVLPSDEILSRLMFSRGAGSLSPFQAIQLAQAVARLSGKGGPDFLDRTRKALGVDTLDVNVGKNGPSVGASRYISRNIRLGVKTGATPEESGVSVNVDVTRRIKLKGEATRDGRGSVGIGAEIEY
jgi:translocation and assembly module TamB